MTDIEQKIKQMVYDEKSTAQNGHVGADHVRSGNRIPLSGQAVLHRAFPDGSPRPTELRIEAQDQRPGQFIWRTVEFETID